MSERPVVCYHASCMDGHGAAWAAHRALGDAYDYVPVSYGQPPPDVACQTLYILDFCFPRDVLRRLISFNRHVTVIDHHDRAGRELAGLAEESEGKFACVFDPSKSGAMLSWEFFHPGKPVPYLIELIQDRDLWSWKLPKSRELSAWLSSHPQTFEAWDQFANSIAAPHLSRGYTIASGDGPAFDYVVPDEWIYSGFAGSAVEQGEAILRAQAEQVRRICSQAREIELDGHKVLCANTSVYQSEVGEALAESRPFAATFYVRGDGKRSWSLRSREGGANVTEIAKKRGGGGHTSGRTAGWEELAS